MHEINPMSVLALKIEMHFNGILLSTGTGFVVESAKGPMLITNRHNVTGKDNRTGKHLSKTAAEPNSVVIFQHLEGNLGNWIAKTEALYQRDPPVPRWFEHPILNGRADFVALPLTQLQNVKLFPCSIEESSPHLAVGPAETISVIGFPFGNSARGFAIWATGFIASDPSIDYEGLPLLLVDCRTRQGQSGSPVVAFRAAGFNQYSDGNTYSSATAQSRFMGIYSGRMNVESDIGIVWKASAIRELIKKIEGKYEYNFGRGASLSSSPVTPTFSALKMHLATK